MSIFALRRRWVGVPLSTGLTMVAVFVLGPLVGWAAATIRWDQFEKSSTMMIALLVGIPAMPVLIRWPVVSTFGLYALLVPFEGVAGIGGGATLTRLLGMLAAGGLLIVGLSEGRLLRPPAVALWWGALVLWGGLTAAWALDAGLALSRLPTAISLFMLFLVAASFRVSRTELNAVCILAVAGGAAAAIAGYVFGVDDFEAGRRGTLAVGVNANGFAASLLPAVALAVGGFLKLRGVLVKTMALAAIAVLGIGIFITISRSTLLALGVVVVVLVYRVGVRWPALMVVLVLLGLLGLMPEHFFQRVASPLTGADATGSGRTVIWSIGLTALDEFWMWGAGLSNYTSAYARYTAIPPADFAKGAHNLYLGTWVELGIVGFAIMLVAITSQLQVAWRGRRSGSLVLYAMEAAMWGHLVAAFFGDPLWGKRHWMLCILLIWAGRLATESAWERLWARRASAPEGAQLRSHDIPIPPIPRPHSADIS